MKVDRIAPAACARVLPVMGTKFGFRGQRLAISAVLSAAPPFELQIRAGIWNSLYAAS